jgi:hypothetical protein
MVINGHDITGKRVAGLLTGSAPWMDRHTKQFLLDALMTDEETQATLRMVGSRLVFTRELFGNSFDIALTKR